MIPMIPVSKNAVANRRLYLTNRAELIDFSDGDVLSRISLNEGLDGAEICALPQDLVSRGTNALRLHAASLPDGSAAHTLSFSYRFPQPLSLQKTPTLTFAFSAYDGERDSQYFSDVKENKFFVERPDPLLISRSYLTVTLLSADDAVSRTVQLTDYGFNRIFANFSGERILGAVDGIRFTYHICEKAEQWQRVMKLDTVYAGMEVDFTLKGSGMETLFAAQNATVQHLDGVLTLACGADATVSLPDLTDAQDTVCDVFLPVKNTLLLRMSADVPELSLTVGFCTEGDAAYLPENRKTFVLHRADHEQTLFLNLSDCPGAQGELHDPRRLTGLTLSPDRPCTLRIRKIAFEQEKPIRRTAGCFLSCIADPAKETILFTCAVDPRFSGSELRIFDGFMDVIRDDRETLSALSCIASETIDNTGTVTLEAPLMRGQVTRLASEFIGAVVIGDGEWIPMENRTVIENWRDFCGENPYAFTLPETVYDVTDFGAKGDGYTDDTDAIQAALDACTATGGIVYLPDDPTPDCTDGYGRRYVVTNLRVHGNTELRIPLHAVLWQADDVSLYRILPRFGHNVSMTGVNWPANHSSGNYPLIYAFREENIRITGGGTVRMADIESRSVDGYFHYIGDNVCVGCQDRMHTIPIGLPECENVEVSDLNVIRSSAPYLILNAMKRVYIGNVRMDESKCTGADGMWPCGSDGVVFDRVMMNNNDDGICLSSNYNDPRDMLWYYAYPGWDHGTHHISLHHSRLSCYTFTASAISFCIWGTDSPDLSRVEVTDIDIFDTVLEGRLSIGGWTDNPYYGVFPFDGSETDDFSPVKNMTVRQCELRSPTGIDNLRITNLYSDCGLRAPSQFEYGDFRRRPAERNPGWVTGLSNWSYSTREAVEQVLLYDVPCASLRKLRAKACDLWQGLYLPAGTHTMTFRYKASGTFQAFVDDREGGSVAACAITEEPNGYSKGKNWVEGKLTFTLPVGGLYRLGLRATEQTVAVYATDFHVD